MSSLVRVIFLSEARASSISNTCGLLSLIKISSSSTEPEDELLLPGFRASISEEEDEREE